MQKTTHLPATRPARRWVAAATLSLLLTFAGLTARAQTDHRGTPPRTRGTAPLSKGATTDKGTYTSQDTPGRRAAGSTGLPPDSTRQEGGQYGSAGNTGTRPDTTGTSRSGAPSDTIGGGGKASHESGSRTNDGSQLNRNRTQGTGSGKRQ